MSQKELTEWYTSRRPTFLALSELVASTLQSILRRDEIDYLAVTYRAKTLESFVEKTKRKSYDDPTSEITDLAAVRIITYVESDIIRIKERISESFSIDESDSGDKTTELGTDRFGYRSLHLICHIGELRAQLPEFAPYFGLRFEIQIRTALQHAWAEIEHDRSYKLSGELPSHLKRRFHLIAGLLELADREFDSLTSDIANYGKEVEAKTRSGELEIEVNSTSLSNYLKERFKNLDIPLTPMRIPDTVVKELKCFGVTTLAELDELITPELINALRQYRHSQTSVGILRDAMMFNDLDKYFEDSFGPSWGAWEEDSMRMYMDRYGEERVKDIMEQYGIDVEPYDT